MNQNSDYSLLQHVPTVLRARGYRLYTKSGQRLVDLWLNGGAAILGHTPTNKLRELKNTASRGLYAPFPHFMEARFLKALSKLLPGHSFRIFASPPPELVTLFKTGAAKLWRPFTSHTENQTANTPLLILVLQGIQVWRDGLPHGLCVVAALSENSLEKLPAGDTLPPLLLAVAARGVYDVIASPQRANPSLPRVAKALQNSRWERNGIYLTLKNETNADEWTTLFKQFLDAGFLLPPNQCHPLVLPGELSDGEDAKLAGVLG